MSNLLNGLTLTAIAEESLPVLQRIVPPLLAFHTDFSRETAAAYGAINTRYPTAVSASLYTRTAGYTAQDATGSQVQISLSDVLHSVSAFTDYEVSTITMPRLINTFLEGNMFGVVNVVWAGINSQFTMATYGTASYTGSTFTFDNAYRTVIGTLKQSGSTSPKSLVLNVPYYGMLLNDVKNNYQIGTTELIREGTIGRLGGVAVYEAPNFNNLGEGLAGIGVGKEALTLATRLPVISVASGIEEVEEATEPESELTLQLRLSRNPWTGLTYIGYYLLYGYAKGQTQALTRITDGTHP
jgi:hypothetical protein